MVWTGCSNRAVLVDHVRVGAGGLFGAHWTVYLFQVVGSGLFVSEGRPHEEIPFPVLPTARTR